MGALTRAWARCRAWLSSLLLTVSLTAGCADYTEVDDLYVMTGLGVDVADDGRLRVTADIINPDASQSQQTVGTGGGSQTPDLVVQTEADSLEMAIDNVQRRLPHRVYLSHNAVVVLGEGIVQRQLQPLMDELERNRSIRRSELLIMTKDRAADVLSARVVASVSSALRLQDVAEQAADWSPVLRSDQLHVMRSWLSPSGTSAMIWIDMGSQGDPIVRGLALVTREGRTLWMDAKEWRGMLWWLSSTRGLLDSVACPKPHGAGSAGGGRAGEAAGHQGEDGLTRLDRTVSIHWLGTRTRVRWAGTAQKPWFWVEWRGEGGVERGCASMRLDADEYSRLEAAAASLVRTEMQAALQRARRAGVDAMGLQNALYQADAKAYQTLSAHPDWWQTAPVRYDIRARLVRSYMVTHSPFGEYAREEQKKSLGAGGSGR